MIGRALKKESRFQVVAEGNAYNVKGPYSSAFFEIDVDWSLTDRKRVAAIQQSLNADYVYILWAPNATNSNGLTRLDVVAQLFASGGVEVGQGQYVLHYKGEDRTYLVEGTKRVAEELAEKTGMAKRR